MISTSESERPDPSAHARNGVIKQGKLKAIFITVLVIAVAATYLVTTMCCGAKTRIIAAGTRVDIDQKTLQRWTESAHPDVVYETVNHRAIALRLRELDAERAIKVIARDRDVRYYYYIDQVEGLIATDAPSDDATNREQNAHDRRLTDVVGVQNLHFSAPLFQFDVMVNDLGLGKSPKIMLGKEMQLTAVSVSQLKSTNGTIAVNIMAGDGRTGVLVLGSRAGEIFAEGQLTGSSFSLRLLGGASYQLVQRDRSNLPGDPSPTSMNRPSLDRWAKLRSQVQHISAHERVTVGLWLTEAAAKYLDGRCTKSGSEQELLNNCQEVDAKALEARLAANVNSFDKAFALGGLPQRGVDLHVFDVKAPWPNSQDARSVLSEICRPFTRTPRARQLHHQAVQSDVDVKALIVWNLCDSEDPGNQTRDLCGQGVPTVTQCRTDQPYLANTSPQKLCGLAAQTSATDPDHGAVIIDAACLLDGMIHHEIGHLMGGQHGIGGQPELDLPPSTARAFTLTGSYVLKPALTIMASRLECPSANCTWLDRFSSPDPRAAESIGGGSPVVPGDEDHNNDEVIERNFATVASFASLRTKLCQATVPTSITVPFDFNRPRREKNGQWVQTKRGKTAATRLMDARSHSILAISDDCPTYVRISGHSDSIKGPDPSYNTKLSEARASLVEDVLSQTLANSVIVCEPLVPFGPSKPLGPNTTTAGRAANRRVEVSISTVPCSG